MVVTVEVGVSRWVGGRQNGAREQEEMGELHFQ